MSEPAWEHLPHDPQRFFGLANDFDRAELKRCYNRLIKVFKPEKFPAEFQRIRAAYETLDQRLRYGAEAAAPRMEIPKYDWGEAPPPDPPLAAATVETGQAASPPLPRKSWSERLATESPSDFLSELNGLTEKQPFHYFALALIEDAQPEAEPLTFLKWVLRGLKRWPGDPGLCELLTVFLKHDVTIEQAPMILKVIAKTVRDDRFYFLTEGLWDRLLREANFNTFRTTLKACEAQLVDHRISARLAFYVHILKPAMWLADDEWIDATFDFVNAQGEKLLWRFESDLELLLQLREYMQQRPELIASSHVCHSMDQALRAYCIHDEATFDRVFLTCSVELGSESDAVLDAFPLVLKNDTYGPLYRLWICMDHDVSERHGIVDDSADASKLVKSARAMFRRTQERSDKSNIGSVWTITGLLYLALKGLTYVLPILGIGALLRWLIPGAQSASGNSGLAFLVVIVSLAGGLGAGWSFSKWVLLPNWYRFCRYWALKCYHQLWRTELVPFLRQTRLPYGDFLEVLQQAEHDEIHCSGWIAHFSRIDYGLAFVGLAQRYIV